MATLTIIAADYRDLILNEIEKDDRMQKGTLSMCKGINTSISWHVKDFEFQFWIFKDCTLSVDRYIESFAKRIADHFASELEAVSG